MDSPHRWLVEFTAQYLVLVWAIAVLVACLVTVVTPFVARLCARLQLDFGLGPTGLDRD